MLMMVSFVLYLKTPLAVDQQRVGRFAAVVVDDSIPEQSDGSDDTESVSPIHVSIVPPMTQRQTRREPDQIVPSSPTMVEKQHQPPPFHIQVPSTDQNLDALMDRIRKRAEILRPCGPQLSRLQHFVDESYWHSIKSETMHEKREAWMEFLNEEIPKTFGSDMSGYAKYGFKGRGIIYTASGRTLQRALASIRIIRERHDCRLPIQVWYMGEELNADQRAQLRAIPDVEPKDLLVEQRKFDEFADFKVGHAYGSNRNYHIKTLVLLLSEFEEFLYLDSDNMPLQNPETLFDTIEYRATGALFWPDYWKMPTNQPIWPILGRQCEDEFEQESGQLVINKRIGFKALLLSMFFQKDHAFYFRILLGDKDTFRFAWKLTQTPYYMIEQPAGVAGRIRQGKFCGHTMLQFDPRGQLMFAHTTAMKTTYSIHAGNTWEALQYFDRASAVDMTDSETRTTSDKRRFQVSSPLTFEYTGGVDKVKEQGGIGIETYSNPCLNLGVDTVTVETTTDVLHALGPDRALDSFRVVTESWPTYQQGRYAWFEEKYYQSGGPGSRSDATCGNGQVGNGQCQNPDECCSAWGWCGTTVDHCSQGCLGGPCYRTRQLPENPLPDFKYCGGGQVGFGLCPDPGTQCCSRFGWCGTSKEFCDFEACVSGPCLEKKSKKT